MAGCGVSERVPRNRSRQMNSMRKRVLLAVVFVGLTIVAVVIGIQQSNLKVEERKKLDENLIKTSRDFTDVMKDVEIERLEAEGRYGEARIAKENRRYLKAIRKINDDAVFLRSLWENDVVQLERCRKEIDARLIVEEDLHAANLTKLGVVH